MIHAKQADRDDSRTGPHRSPALFVGSLRYVSPAYGEEAERHVNRSHLPGRSRASKKIARYLRSLAWDGKPRLQVLLDALRAHADEAKNRG